MQENTIKLNLREPVNPIIVFKDVERFQPHKCFEITPPFLMKAKGVTIEVKEGEAPIYFKRKRIKMKNNTPISMEIKYRIGKKIKDKEISYWINSKGEII